MGRLRVLLGVEAALLVAFVACASAELALDVSPLSPDELVQISEAPKVVPAKSGASVLKQAKADIAALEQAQAKKALEAQEKARVDLKIKLEKERVELDAAKAEASSEAKALTQARNPIKGEPELPSLDVIKSKAEAVAAEKTKLVILAAKKESAENKLQVASDTVRKGEEQVEKATLDKIKNEERKKKEEVITVAEDKAQKAAVEEKHKKEVMKAAVQEKTTNIDNAEQAIERAEEKAVQEKYTDQQAIQEQEVKFAETSRKLVQAKQNLKKAKVVASASIFEEESAGEDLAAAKIENERAIRAKDNAIQNQKDTASAGDRGKAMLQEAKEGIELNKEALSNARANIRDKRKSLAEAKHGEGQDKMQAAQTMESVRTLNVKIEALEKKKETVQAFGESLKQKAKRDAQLAQQGALKARADYADAKEKYDRFMKAAQRHHEQYEKDENERQKAIKSVMMALEDNDVKSAIIGGENHQGIDALAELSRTQHKKYMTKARSAKAQMDAAKADQEMAEKLQLSANKQFDQAAQTEEVARNHRNKLNALQKEATAHENAATRVLTQARKKTQQVQEAFDTATKKFKEREAAEHYLKNVKMVVAQQLIDNAQTHVEADSAEANVEDKEVAGTDEQVKQAQAEALKKQMNVKSSEVEEQALKDQVVQLTQQKAATAKEIQKDKAKLFDSEDKATSNIEAAKEALEKAKSAGLDLESTSSTP